ncbi:efflux transporter outer membrane subunit [Gaetbulibacter saemankumensis]|uniref:efflux transporter outer membrane subunit n=1 Tax=Gaetbulibacter saemankumensis TaxID=311208 RepID=UPI0003FFB3F3|nr:efflux transporter outer membrane subunit [Gaetbulibacter saemankumensis]
MIKKHLIYSFIFTVFLGLSSCHINKTYVAPQIDDVSKYRNASSTDTLIFANSSWWRIFNDTTLVALIEEGLNNNYPLKNTVSLIKQSQLQLEIAQAQLYPSINYGITGDITKTSIASNTTQNALAAANVSYTLDVWGRIKNQNEAALQAYLATEMASNEVQATLVTQIASIYFTLRDVDNKIIVAENMISSLTEFKDVIEARYDGGFVSKVDLNQVIINQQEAEVTLQALFRSRAQLEHALSILLGATPKSIPRGLALQEQVFSSDFPAGVPVELLRRRPSILIAERKLKAQLAVIGATEALNYPNFTISLDLGAQLTKPSLLFSTLTGNLLGPIFNNNRIKNTIQLEEEIYNQLVNEYKQSYLLAFQEVEDALIAIDTYHQEYQIRQTQLQLSQEALNLSWVRYNEGVTSFLEFINLQTSLFNAQLNASESYKLYLQSIVKLYLALGGGWTQTNM